MPDVIETASSINQFYLLSESNNLRHSCVFPDYESPAGEALLECFSGELVWNTLRVLQSAPLLNS